jgi:hypothetical protein
MRLPRDPNTSNLLQVVEIIPRRLGDRPGPHRSPRRHSPPRAVSDAGAERVRAESPLAVDEQFFLVESAAPAFERFYLLRRKRSAEALTAARIFFAGGWNGQQGSV